MESDLAKTGDGVRVQRDYVTIEHCPLYGLQYLQAFECTGSVKAKKARK